MKLYRLVILIGFYASVLVFLSFMEQEDSAISQLDLTDHGATKQTKALYLNMKNLSSDNVLFGHQDDLAYGVHWKNWHKMRSDVNDVVGDFPAVFGWEMSKLGSSDINIDTVNFEHMKDWMKEVYKAGGINEVAWHMDNFVDGKSSWDVGPKVVETILPGGVNHEAYQEKLDHFADFVDDLKVGFIFKTKIPIIFRPFHEHTGSWFWWGEEHCTPEQYKELWRYTVTYLRDEKGLHNLLYAYSPDVFRDEAHYLERYPGDEWVDILGVDDYHDVGAGGNIEDLSIRLRTVVALAEEKDKIAALTETGYEAIPDPLWWTQKLLNAIKNDPEARKISYVLVWRNGRTSHHYAPYPGHLSAPDFIDFYNDPFTVFLEGLPSMYKFK